MLKVNLLPPEKRKLTRTPLYAMIPLVLGILVFGGSLAGSAVLYFEKTALEEDLDRINHEIANLEPYVQRNKKLKEEIANEEKEFGSIAKVAKRDVVNGKTVLWEDILGALVEVVSKNPRVWLDRVEYLAASQAMTSSREFQAAGNAKFGIRLMCNCVPDLVDDPKSKEKRAVANVDYMIKFRKDLKEHPLLKAIFPDVNPKAPEYDFKEDKEAVEKFRMTFDVTLVARTP